MAEFADAHVLSFLLMAALLACSAFFSGSETAIFNLTPRDLQRLRAAPGRLPAAILTLAGEPSEFLNTVLFCNLVVNLLIFSTASSLSSAAAETLGAGAAVGLSVGALLLVITFGEITPKAVAATVPMFGARLCALPMLALHRLAWPVRRVLRKITKLAEWLVLRGESMGRRNHRRLQTILRAYTHQGTLQTHEGEMLREILDLPNMRLRECMRPRVDVLLLPEHTPAGEAYRQAAALGRDTVLLYRRDEESVTGTADVPTLFLAEPETPAGLLATAPVFMPETQCAADALQILRRQGAGPAVVVDEYGAVSGIATTWDILEEIIGATPDGEIAPPEVTEVADGEYLLSGALSIRNFRSLLEYEKALPSGETLGGVIGALVGRVPEAGDEVTVHNLRFRVESVARRRPTLVRLTVLETEGAPC